MNGEPKQFDTDEESLAWLTSSIAKAITDDIATPLTPESLIASSKKIIEEAFGKWEDHVEVLFDGVDLTLKAKTPMGEALLRRFLPSKEISFIIEIPKDAP